MRGSVLGVLALTTVAACSEEPSDRGASEATVARCVRTVDAGNGFGVAAMPADIDEHGDVVGHAVLADGSMRAFLFRGNSGGIVELGTLHRIGESDALAMNDSGDVVGWSEGADGSATRAVRWRDGVVEDLGTLGGAGGSALDVNERGQIVGSAETATGHVHAFVWEGGAMKDLGTLGGSTSEAVRINERGEVAGASTTPAGDLHGFLWDGRAMTDLGPVSPSTLDLNDRGEIVFDDEQGAFVWRAGARTEIAAFGPNPTSMTAINARGDIIGLARMPDGHDASFLRRDGSITDLAPAGGHSFVAALALNEHAQVVGFAARGESAAGRAFSWQDGELTWLTSEDDESVASVVNGRGLIAGWATGGLKIWEVRECSALGHEK